MEIVEVTTAVNEPKSFVSVASPILDISCQQSFSQLGQRETLYAYYMTRASLEGSKMCYFQRSYESPALFVLFSLIFGNGVSSLKERSLASLITEHEWKQMCVYTAAVM